METKFEDVYQELVSRNCEVKITKANNLQVKCEDGTLLTFCHNGYIRRRRPGPCGYHGYGQDFQWLITSKRHAIFNGQKWPYASMINKIRRTPEMLKGAN
jgi:hypothetical protein